MYDTRSWKFAHNKAVARNGLEILYTFDSKTSNNQKHNNVCITEDPSGLFSAIYPRAYPVFYRFPGEEVTSPPRSYQIQIFSRCRVQFPSTAISDRIPTSSPKDVFTASDDMTAVSSVYSQLSGSPGWEQLELMTRGIAVNRW